MGFFKNLLQREIDTIATQSGATDWANVQVEEINLVALGGNLSLTSVEGDHSSSLALAADGSIAIDGFLSTEIGGGNGAHQLLVNGDGIYVGNLFIGPTAPAVPLTTPTVQNVIDALVGIGLIAQHD